MGVFFRIPPPYQRFLENIRSFLLTEGIARNTVFLSFSCTVQKGLGVRIMSDDQQLPASLSPVGIRDTRLIELAIRNKWPIREEIREALIERQVAIATSKTVSPRESTSAFRSLVAANQQNIALANRPKRKLKPLTRETVIVIGDLEESRRRAIQFMHEQIAERDQRDASQAVSPADA